MKYQKEARTTMERINLEAPIPKTSALHSDPDWSFASLLSELSLSEKKRPTYVLKLSAKTAAREVSQPKNSEDNVDEKPPVVGGWNLFLSDSEEDSEDDDDDDSTIVSQNKLMSPVGFVEAALSEITNDRQRSLTDETRSQKMELETSLMIENEKYASDLARTMNQAEAKLEAVNRQDLQYQRELAGALDAHMVAIQRDHEHKSQLEERRIRDDAARKRHEQKLLQEKSIEAEAQAKRRQEKLQQEKIEAEKTQARRAEAAKAATLEAEGRAAEKTAQEKKNAQYTGNLIKGAETALNLEAQRLKIYEELCAQNEAFRTRSNVDTSALQRGIKRYIRTTTGNEDNISIRAHNLGNLINQPEFPKSVSIMMLVDTIVTQCVKPDTDDGSIYGYGQCAVIVSAKEPLVMDILIAKLNQVCIYTVPKHISDSNSAFPQKDDRKNEDSDSFLVNMASYMKLYGAVVQTEAHVQNRHGLEEAWRWLSRFLNTLPPNLYTAVALSSFLEMAGYTMHRRFGRKFVKMVDIISRDFVDALPENLKSTPRMVNLRNYLKSKEYLNEPEKRVKRVDLLSWYPQEI